MQTTQRAVLIHAYGDATAAQLATIDRPTAGPGQVLVQVGAAGVNAIDWKVRSGYVRDAFPLQLPAVLGAELAGVVVAVGPGTTRFQVGDRVMGAVGGLGAYAEYVALDAARLAPTPEGLDDVHAAAIPVAAVTAWQSLRHAGPVQPGQRILIHGAAGGVGSYAVQFAKRVGAQVFATASATQLDYVRSLGADHVIDYRAQRFEDIATHIDLVLDYVGSAVLAPSWQVLAPGGAIVSTAAPDITAHTPAGHRGLWFTSQPDAALLQRLALEVAQGTLQARLGEVVGVADLPLAIERIRTTAHSGKVVADFSR
ncbi:NADP-dependent oxidoreductase [Xanthomonas campestris]|uniref:NADP-dependent oxidoreductase n=2 Tax=Xanthomonas campestris TaxID=339 RepID=A0AAJ3CEI2_XANCA|nr:NADP-dependent oxidoreductase [Xanthomonas campestris]MEC3888110.1 NADP-dependent oxidoreductase [Xanthomonas campestris pv. papavericola]